MCDGRSHLHKPSARGNGRAIARRAREGHLATQRTDLSSLSPPRRKEGLVPPRRLATQRDGSLATGALADPARASCGGAPLGSRRARRASRLGLLTDLWPTGGGAGRGGDGLGGWLVDGWRCWSWWGCVVVGAVATYNNITYCMYILHLYII